MTNANRLLNSNVAITRANLPKKAIITEVGPRDGFQFEKKIIPTTFKLEIINSLIDAGLKNIQAASFVHPGIVPQMADAKELISLLPKRDDIRINALVLNQKGVKRAWNAGIKSVEISVSASDLHSRKNAGISHEKGVRQGVSMIDWAKSRDMHVRAGVQCGFGCFYEGKIPISRVLKMAEKFIKTGIDEISIADTTGMANPVSIKKLIKALFPVSGQTPIALHLHDTRGLGLVNVMAALECGITRFDTAFGGMGGCPFIPDASGNIATEDTAYLMKTLDIETGIDIKKLAECSKEIEYFLKKRLSGKIYRLYGE